MKLTSKHKLISVAIVFCAISFSSLKAKNVSYHFVNTLNTKDISGDVESFTKNAFQLKKIVQVRKHKIGCPNNSCIIEILDNEQSIYSYVYYFCQQGFSDKFYLYLTYYETDSKSLIYNKTYFDLKKPELSNELASSISNDVSTQSLDKYDPEINERSTKIPDEKPNLNILTISELDNNGTIVDEENISERIATPNYFEENISHVLLIASASVMQIAAYFKYLEFNELEKDKSDYLEGQRNSVTGGEDNSYKTKYNEAMDDQNSAYSQYVVFQGLAIGSSIAEIVNLSFTYGTKVGRITPYINPKLKYVSLQMSFTF